jgi:tetratricopeptide (TPR) repeat protein
MNQTITTEKNHSAVVILVFMAAVVFYVPLLYGGFAWDDLNQYLGVSKYTPLFEREFARPLFALSMGLDHAIWGEKAGGFHFTNTALHAVSAVMVYFLAFQLFSDSLLAVFAALLFALHPVHTEPVAWISARSELLMTVFFIPAFIFYIRFMKTGGTEPLLLSCLFFLLSLLSKQSALAFLGVILAQQMWATVDRRRTFKAVGLFTLIFSVYYFSLGKYGEFSVVNSFDPYAILNGLWYYLGKLMVPTNLNLMPSLPEFIAYSVFALVSLAVIVILYTEGKKREAFLITWIMVTLLPALLLTGSDAASPLAERYLYLPSIGFCILLSTLLTNATISKKALAFMALIVLLYSTGTFDRVQVWGDDVSIWHDTVQKSPQSILARINYGTALLESGAGDDARKQLTLALRNDAITEGDMLRITELLADSGKQSSEKTIVGALADARGKAQAYYGLGFMYYKHRDKRRPETLQKAIRYLEKSVSVSPSFVRPRYYLGLSYLETGDYDKAEKNFSVVMKLDIDGQYIAQTRDFLSFIKSVKKMRATERTT